MRLTARGYHPDEAIMVFDRIQEVKKGEGLDGSWYSSHPSNHQRVAALRELARNGALVSGKLQPSDNSYRTFVEQIAIENIQLKLHARKYELALDAANRGLSAKPGAAQFYVYKGEAYRQMADDPKGAAREHAWIYDKSFGEKLVAEFETRRTEFYQSAEDAYRQALTPDCELLYLHSQPYAAEAEGALNVRDPALAITWPLPVTDLSERDAQHRCIDAGFTGLEP